MILLNKNNITIRRFVFGDDNMDPITILLDKDTHTCTVTDNFGETHSYTWRSFNTEDNDFIKFFADADKEWWYFCNKLGIGPTHLNLKKSKRNALKCFFSNINKDTSKFDRTMVIHDIESIDTNDPVCFEYEAHNIMDAYSDTWECNFKVMEWEGTEKNMRDAIKMLASVIREEFDKNLC